MFKIVMEKECGCFKKQNEFKNPTMFDTKEEAYQYAIVMQNRMNQEFCQKHEFHAVDKGDEIEIKVALREEDDDDVYGTGLEGGGCCGGGHCG